MINYDKKLKLKGEWGSKGFTTATKSKETRSKILAMVINKVSGKI